MSAIELATGYVALVPSAKGITSGIAKELGAPLEAAAVTSGARASKALSGRFSTGVKGLGRAVGTGLIAGSLAFAAIGGGVLKLGTDFKSAYNTIRVETGATGKSLNGLEGDFKAVLSQRPDNMNEVALAISKLHQGLDLTGPSLQEVAKQALELSDITHTDLGANLDSVTKLFNNFGISAGAQPAKLDELFRASQATGISVSDLASTMAKAGSPLRQIGFSFEDSASLLGLLNKAGINAGSIMPALSKSIATAAKEGKSAGDVFRSVFTAIRNAPNDTKAAGAAIAVFGARAGPNLAGLIRQGKLSYDQLASSIARGGDTIDKATGDTEGFSAKFKIFLNQLRVAVEPIAIAAVTFAISAMTAVAPHLQTFADIVHSVALRITGFFSGNPTAKFAALASIIGVVLAAAIVGVASKLTVFLNPAVLIIAAIAALAAGAVYAYTHFAGFRDVVDSVADRVTTFASAALPRVRAAFSELITIAGGLVTKIRGVDFSAIFGRVAAVLGPVVSGVRSLASAIVPLAVSTLPVLAAAFHGAFDVVKVVLPPAIAAFYVAARVAGVVLGGALKLAGGIVRELAAHMSQLKPILLAAAAGFAAFVAVKGTISLFQTVGSAARASISAVQSFGSSIAGIGSKVTGFFAAGGGKDDLTLRFWKVRDAVKGAATSIASGVKSLLSWGKTAITSALSTAKDIAALVAHKVASVAAAVAQKAMAAAQWLLNAALDANPIGLVVIAIAAFVAAFVLAYQHVGAFRDVVQRAFGIVRSVIIGVFNWVKNNWPLLLAILTGPIGIAVLAITKNWDTIKTAFSAVKDWIGARVTEIVTFITGIPGRIAATVSTLWNGLTSGASTAAQWVHDRIDDVVGFFTGLPGRISGAVSGMFDGIKNAFRSALNWIISKWNDFHFTIGGGSFLGHDLPSFTVNTPNLPLLAGGGVITSPTAAILGETAKARPEIASPASMLESIFRNTLDDHDRRTRASKAKAPLVAGDLVFNTRDARDAVGELSWLAFTRG